MVHKSTGPDFEYEIARDSAGLPASVAVFTDRPSVRDQIVEDLDGAGFRAVDGGTVATLLEGQIKVLGDVVLVDCPIADTTTIAALTRLDMRIARAGSQLIVSTTIDALDDVFAAMDQSEPQILVDPSRADRLVAVGRVLWRVSNAKVREMSEEDRLMLLRLTEQVDAIAQRLDRLAARVEGDEPKKLSDFKREFRGADTELAPIATPIGKAVHPPLPDPRMIRQIIANRQARAKFFDAELFADPAWDMLLDLTAAHAEHRRVSVTSLCIASGVPATTALRWVRQMVDSGIFVRIADSTDKRRAFIALSDNSTEAMARYFRQIAEPVAAAA
ncbi:MAG: MarR family transcriptional regulator [Pseudomonadota bacterium]